MTGALSRRALLTVGVTALGAVLVTACSQSSQAAQSATAPKGSAVASKATAAPAAQSSSSTSVVTIRWQNRNSASEIAEEKKFVTDTFEKTYPNIKVTVEPAPDNRDQKLIASMVAGTAPDVFESWSDNVTQFADRKQVLDLNPLVIRDYKASDLKDFYNWQWQAFNIPVWLDNAIQHMRFGMPKYVNVMFTWYNKDIFDKANMKYPTETWDQNNYAEAAIKLTSKKGSAVDTWGLFYPVWSWDRFWYKVDAWGGHVVDPKDWTKATFNQPKALAAFEWSRKLMWDNQAMAQELQISGGAGQSFNSVDLFAAGKFAMAEDGFYPFAMAKAIQKKIKWAYQHVPKGPVERKVLGTTDGFCIWKNTKQQDAAWKLLMFLSGNDYQTAQVRSTGLLPVRYSVLANWKKICLQSYPELEAVNLDVGPAAMKMGYPGNRHFFKQDAEAQQILIPALQKVFVSGGTPVSYLNGIAQQIDTKMA